MVTQIQNPGRQQSATKAKKASALAKKKADWVTKMSPEERRKLIAEYEEFLRELAPTLESAESDLLEALLLIGAQFVARYFPDANHASLHISKYPDRGPPVFNVMFPMALARSCPKE